MQYIMFYGTQQVEIRNKIFKTSQEVNDFLKEYVKVNFVSKFEEVDKLLKDYETINVLLIKGEILKPQPIEVVTQYDLK